MREDEISDAADRFCRWLFDLARQKNFNGDEANFNHDYILTI